MKYLRPGIAGSPSITNAVRIISCIETKDKNGCPYLYINTKDVNSNQVFGHGEIQMKENNVSFEYYKIQEKTDEVIGKDGFFSTGDMG